MRTLVFLLTVLSLSSGGASRSLEPRPIERYREVFGPQVTLTWNATRSAPMALRGLMVPTEGKDPGERARRFALAHAEWLGLEGEVRVVDAHEVVLAGQTFRGVNLERLWHGLPVEGHSLHVRMDAQDRVRSVTSSVAPLVVAEPARPITAEAAVRAIRDTYQVAAVGIPTEVVLARGNAGRVAWRVPVAVIPLQAHFFVWVDAGDGHILSERPAGFDQAMREIPLLHPEESPVKRLAPLPFVLALCACGDDAVPATSDIDTAIADSAPDVAEDTTPEADTTAPDTTPPSGPLARVWPVAPGVSEALVEVELEHLDEPYDLMKGAYARVQSCTPDLDRGVRTQLDFGPSTIEIVSCVPEAKTHIGSDGSYLDIAPPATPADDDGRFAELMMYHHMQVIHDYFKEGYSLTERDHPLEALTNVTTFIERCDAWTGVANAAFVPHEGLAYFVEGLDVSSLQGDAIIFSGTQDKNFAFDASVIYHEYTHAMVGATRLNATFVDAQGLNSLPGALNEAYADYFAATQTGEPTVGMYALTDFAVSGFCGLSEEDAPVENYARDLRAERRCPDDLVSESHGDSEIFSSALWAIREQLGAADADTIVLYAALELTDTSDFNFAADMTIQGANDLYGAEAGAAVKAIFEARNLVHCDRIIPIEKIGSRDIELRVEGTRLVDPNPYPGYVPGYVQFGLVVPEGTQKATVLLDAVQGGFAGTGQPLEVDAVVKVGAEPVTYTYGAGAGSATHDGDLTVTVAEDKTFVIQNPNNVPLKAGPWTFSLHNKARRTLRITAISATFE